MADIGAAQNRGGCAHIWEICGAVAPLEYEPPWENVAAGLWRELEIALSQISYREHPLYKDYDRLTRHMAHTNPAVYRLMAEICALSAIAKKRSSLPGVVLTYAPDVA